MQDDYLLRSGAVSADVLNAETMEIWTKLILYSDEHKHATELIQKLFIPRQISLTKFTINLQYIKDRTYCHDSEERIRGKDSYSLVAPSLRNIYRTPTFVLTQFTDEFIAAFPDVVDWTMEASSSYLFDQLYDPERSARLIQNDGSFRMDYLNVIMDNYVRSRDNSSSRFECQIIDKPQSTESTLTELLYFATVCGNILKITNLGPYKVYFATEDYEMSLHNAQSFKIDFNTNVIMMPAAISFILENAHIVYLHSVEKMGYTTVYNFTNIHVKEDIIGVIMVSDKKIAISELVHGHKIIFENNGWDIDLEPFSIKC